MEGCHLMVIQETFRHRILIFQRSKKASVSYLFLTEDLSNLVAARTSVQFSSVSQSCPTLCDPMDRSMPGLPVHCQLLGSTQTCVHWVSDARTYLDLIYCFWVCLKGVSVVNLSFCVLPKWSWKSTGEIHNLVAPHIALELKHLHTVHPFSLVGTCSPDMSSLISVVICLFGDLQKMRVHELMKN